MSDFQGMNKVYAEMFQGHTPSRTTISIKQNPLDALVEIECTAECPGPDIKCNRNHRVRSLLCRPSQD